MACFTQRVVQWKAKGWHLQSKVPRKCAGRHFLINTYVSRGHDWQCLVCKKPSQIFEQVYCHSKQSLLEILLSDKTWLEGELLGHFYRTGVTTRVAVMFTTRPVSGSNRRTEDPETHNVSIKVQQIKDHPHPQ